MPTADAGLDLTGLLALEWERLSDEERHTIERVLRRQTVARDSGRAFDDRRTFGDRLADRIAAFGGSWRFILLFAGWLLAWTALNSVLLGPRNAAFDPYPYVFLNLLLSMLAAIQAPIILMAQNRQAARDRFDAAVDYAVNLKAEIEIRRLHEALARVEGSLAALAPTP